MKVSGFHVIVSGESPVTYNLEGVFYFDNNNELEVFKGRLKLLIGDHTGGNISVETFEEYNKRTVEHS